MTESVVLARAQPEAIHCVVIVGARDGGRGRIRTDERTKRADLQSASFSHLDTLPAKDRIIMLEGKKLARR